MKALYLYLTLVIVAHANTVAHGVMKARPPKGTQVVAFANNHNDWTKRVDLRREQLIAFLDRGIFYPTLSTSLEKQLHWHDMAVSCDGVFTDKRATVFFWEVAAPEFLSIADESGRMCLLYLSPSPLDQAQIDALGGTKQTPPEHAATDVTAPAPQRARR